MNYEVKVQDKVSPVLRGYARELAPEVLHKAWARAEERLFRDHIGGLPKNQLGKSTGFWADAARSTHAEGNLEGCVVSINKLGFRQRFYGGTIKAVKSKYLTIPARAEFYGARARQFTNLRFVMFKSGTAALVIGEGGAEKVTGLNTSRAAGGKKSAGMVAFWLKKEVNQKANPGVIPDDEAIVGAALDVTDMALRRAERE